MHIKGQRSCSVNSHIKISLYVVTVDVLRCACGSEVMTLHDDTWRIGTNTHWGASAFVEVTCEQDTLRLSLKRAFTQHLGLRLRSAEARRQILRGLGRTSIRYRLVASDDLVIAFPDERASLLSVLQDLDMALKRTASRPLTPRLVQDALGITNQERLRWTKDGRLRTHGSVSFRRGQRITVSTYGVRDIERLLATPAIIAGWREEDERAGRKN
jgi:hypothetical protein